MTAKDVSFDWSTAVGSRPENGLRMVQVAGAGLPKPKQIYPVTGGQRPLHRHTRPGPVVNDYEKKDITDIDRS